MSEESASGNRRSSDFRTVYANAFGMVFMGADTIIRFSIIDDIANPRSSHEEQVAVALNIQNLKALGKTIMALIENYEKTTGTQVDINPSIAKNIDDAIKKTGKP